MDGFAKGQYALGCDLLESSVYPKDSDTTVPLYYNLLHVENDDKLLDLQ